MPSSPQSDVSPQREPSAFQLEFTTALVPSAIQRAPSYTVGSRFRPFCIRFGIPWSTSRSGLWLIVPFSIGNQLMLLGLVAERLAY